jgi:hypothetical protein
MSKKIIRNIPLPTNNTWVECLGFMLQTMERDNSSFEFVAGLLSYAIKYGGLTTKQVEAIQNQYDDHVSNIEIELITIKRKKLKVIDGGKK